MSQLAAKFSFIWSCMPRLRCREWKHVEWARTIGDVAKGGVGGWWGDGESSCWDFSFCSWLSLSTHTFFNCWNFITPSWFAGLVNCNPCASCQRALAWLFFFCQNNGEAATTTTTMTMTSPLSCDPSLASFGLQRARCCH